MAQESLQKCYYDDDNSSEVSVYLDTKIAAEDDGKVNDNDNGLGGRNTSNPSGVIDKNLPRQNITSPENSTVETSGSTSSQVTKTGRHSEKHTLGVLGKKFFDNKIPLKRKLKWLNRLATVQDDGTVKFEVPEDIKPQSLDFGTGVVSDGATDEKDVDELENQDIPPLQIVALIVGTRGDVQPFVAIGKRLQEYGHRVRLATHSNFKEFVLASGLEYFPLGGDPKVLAEYMVKNKGFLPSEPSEIPIQRSQIKDIIFSLLPACTEPDPVSKVPFKVDAIIANPPAYGHTDVAEALKVPLHIFFTMPWTPTSEFPHPLSRVKQPVAYRLSYQIVDSMIALGMRDMINEFRKKRLKLRPVTYLSGSHSSPDFPHGYIWSPHLVPKPKDSERDSAEFNVIVCGCGIVAPMWEAWKDGTLDPGRRFVGCSRYKEPKMYCRFFKWCDPPFIERSREVIKRMRDKLCSANEEI